MILPIRPCQLRPKEYPLNQQSELPLLFAALAQSFVLLLTKNRQQERQVLTMLLIVACS